MNIKSRNPDIFRRSLCKRQKAGLPAFLVISAALLFPVAYIVWTCCKERKG